MVASKPPFKLSRDGVYPPPSLNDGILLQAQPEKESQYSLKHIRRFVFDGLNRFDQSDLKSMGMADFFIPMCSGTGRAASVPV
jgi:hypothetical protein